MKVLCPYCGGAEVHISDQCTKCEKICDKKDAARPIESLLGQLQKCLRCGERAFDYWQCHSCGVSVLEEIKETQECILVSDKERALVSAHFQTG